MHWQAKQFVESIRCLLPDYFRNVDVLEIGSAYVNGSIRDIFTQSRHTGVDLSPGKGVDIVASGHEFCPDPPQKFDVIISCECFEHNPHYAATLNNMIGLAKDDGLVIFTCASTGRPEHGTARTDGTQSPGTTAVGWDYYRNLTEEDFATLDLPERLATAHFFSNELSQDLYFIGARSISTARQVDRIAERLAEQVNYVKISSQPDFPGTEEQLLLLSSYCPETLVILYNIASRSRKEWLDLSFWNACLETALRYQDSPPAHYLMYLYYTEAERFNEALNHIRYAHRAVPGSEAYMFALGEAFARCQMHAEAADIFERICRSKAKLGLWLKWCDALAADGQYTAMLQAAHEGMDHLDDDPHLLIRYADAANRLGKYEAAGEALESIINMAQPVPDWLMRSATNRLKNLGSDKQDQTN